MPQNSEDYFNETGTKIRLLSQSSKIKIGRVKYNRYYAKLVK